MKLPIFCTPILFRLLALLMLIVLIVGGVIPEVMIARKLMRQQVIQHELMRSNQHHQSLDAVWSNIREMDQLLLDLADVYDSAVALHYQQLANQTDQQLLQMQPLCPDSLRPVFDNLRTNFNEMKSYGRTIVVLAAANDQLAIYAKWAGSECDRYCAEIKNSQTRLLDAEDKMVGPLQEQDLILTQEVNTLRQWRIIATIFMVVLLLLLFLLALCYHRKQERILRIAKERAEELVQLKDQFVTNISHEIRTPLNALLGFSELLSASALNQRQRRQLEAIRKSGENLQHIINDVLDFSKLEAGMMQHEHVTFGVREQLEHVQTMFLPLAADRHVRLDVHVDADVPRFVCGDPAHLRQILINLVSNAIKFTQQGQVELRVMLKSTDAVSLWLAFLVVDTGIGIAKDQQQAIFRRFYQAVTISNGRYNGTGLGLSIVKKIAELLGGSVSLKSAPGQGSTFTVLLPFSPAVSAPEVVQVSNHKQLLVAEDHPLSRQLINAMLEEQAFTYDLVRRGDEVLEKLRTTSYNLVLLDLQLPVLDGYTTVRRIRDELELNVPVIGMSAGVQADEHQRCLLAGMNDFLAKPFTLSQLMDLIRSYTLPVQDEVHTVTNLSYLQQLSNGNPEFVRKMIALYLSENSRELEELNVAISSGNRSDLLHLLHRMRSTIAFVGLDRVAGDLLTQLEIAASENHSQAALQVIAEKYSVVCKQAIHELRH